MFLNSIPTEEDADAINKNWKFGKSYESLKYIQHSISKCPATIIKARATGQVVGCILVAPDNSMGMLWVDPEYRGRGLGKYIISDLSRKVLELGITPFVFIESLNSASIDLFEKCGFQRVAGADCFWLRVSASRLR